MSLPPTNNARAFARCTEEIHLASPHTQHEDFRRANLEISSRFSLQTMQDLLTAYWRISSHFVLQNTRASPPGTLVSVILLLPLNAKKFSTRLSHVSPRPDCSCACSKMHLEQSPVEVGITLIKSIKRMILIGLPSALRRNL